MSEHDGNFQIGDPVLTPWNGIGKVSKIERQFQNEYVQATRSYRQTEQEIRSIITVTLTHSKDGEARRSRSWKKFYGPTNLQKLDRATIQKLFDRICDAADQLEGERDVQSNISSQ